MILNGFGIVGWSLAIKIDLEEFFVFWSKFGVLFQTGFLSLCCALHWGVCGSCGAY